jgi:ATP-dependent Clp protease ATP-binding subunit ClpC
MVDKTDYRIRIDTDKESKLIINLRRKIELEVIGQDRAIRRLLRAVASYYSDLKDPRRPIGGYIFAGPTGVGKTWMAKVSARHFLGGHDRNRDYMTRIDCSTLSQEHEVARLTGSPPGYIGYGEPPILSQKHIDSYHFDVKVGKDNGTFATHLKNLETTRGQIDVLFQDEGMQGNGAAFRLENEYVANKPYCSVIVFDEIEKAHPNIWNVLLQIMEEGELQLGKSNKKTNFNNSIIILTTNIGQRDIQGMLKGGIGFKLPQQDIQNQDLDQKIYETVKEGVKKRFPPELFKRLDLVVFRPLKEEDFVKILDIFLLDEQERLDKLTKTVSRLSIELEYTAAAKKFLLEKGIDIHYGARTLRATIEKYIRAPISNALSSGEIKRGDKILVDEENGKLVFFRKSRPRGQNAITPKPDNIILLPAKFNN